MKMNEVLHLSVHLSMQIALGSLVNILQNNREYQSLNRPVLGITLET